LKLHSKTTLEMQDEDDLYEPITAALYPNGKGILGTTQRRARAAPTQPDMFRFDSSRYSVSKSRDGGDDSPPAYVSSEHSEDDFSDFAQWYNGPH
jgi:hypothetical protein